MSEQPEQSEPPGQGGYDTRFSLPGVDDPPSTEVGVILLGLGPDRLLAGLGLAGTRDADASTVALLVDRAHHGALDGVTMSDAVAAGGEAWRSARVVLAAAEPATPAAASPRQAWERSYRELAAVGACRPGSATHSYLTACWLRRDEIDGRT